MKNIVCLNGAFMEAEHAAIAPDDRGFTLGDGIFDTLLVKNGKAMDMDAHFQRLERHAEIIGLRLPAPNLHECAYALIEKNGAAQGRLALRTTATRGTGQRGLLPPGAATPTVLMRLSPAPEPPASASAIIAETVRRNEGSPLSRIKSLNAGDQILALMEAQSRGADDALLLNNRGHVTCATAATIFVKLGNDIVTPPISDGVMDGITRASLIASGRVKEYSLMVHDLESCEALWLGNSLRGVYSLTKLNDTDKPLLVMPA